MSFFKKTLIILIITLGLVAPILVLAADTPPAGSATVDTVSLDNPLQNDVTDVPTLVGMIIKGALSVIGALSLFMFIWGAFSWLTSLGNPERISQGAKTMLWAVLGLAITFASYMIVSLLFTV